MSSRFEWKVYDNAGKFIAQTVFAEDAAILMSGSSSGATVRCGYTRKCIVWTEGETGRAINSFRDAANVMRENKHIIQCNAFREAHGEEALQRALAVRAELKVDAPEQEVNKDREEFIEAAGNVAVWRSVDEDDGLDLMSVRQDAKAAAADRWDAKHNHE